MGRKLFEEDAIFRDELMTLDACAQKLTGKSVVGAFLGNGDLRVPFTRLSETHPAVFMVEVALARRLAHDGIVPDCVLGASLGEFAALVTADSLDAEDALRIVIGHAEAVERYCTQGGMLAVMAAPELFETEADLFAETWLAATHFARHFVVSGATDAISRTMTRLRGAGVRCQRLPVEYAFHSPLVSAAEDSFISLMESTEWRSPLCKVVSCAEGGPMHDAMPLMDRGITAKPILFSHAVASIEVDGPCTYVDLGPSGTLATFLKYLLPKASGSSALRTLTAQGRRDLQNVERVVRDLGTARPSGVELRGRYANRARITLRSIA
jgi:acyl transferase domain-containing protein